MTDIYTSQFNYNGKYRMDITAKAKTPFSPTWDIVEKYKSNEITSNIYSAYYHAQMLESYHKAPITWNSILSLDTVVFVCYCNKNSFCHRKLLAHFFEQLGATYKGEI